jgi:hypothetical protein
MIQDRVLDLDLHLEEETPNGPVGPLVSGMFGHPDSDLDYPYTDPDHFRRLNLTFLKNKSKSGYRTCIGNLSATTYFFK